ncbi:MAG: hypothetical protein JWP01_4241 [Myxococcales bacterium]|nr:hypothetical protein [Myxococcales bacterium]
MRSVVVAIAVAGGCSDPVTPVLDAAPLPTALPARLSETGLYVDLASKTVAAANVEFAPRNVLWSDAAAKLRWIQLPANATIDSTDMDRWTFPVGTQWFKEFSKDGKRLETRLIWRVSDTGDREQDTLFGAYVWNDDETEAMFMKEGAVNVRGTDHDVPSADSCWKCHIGEPGRALGFSALQLGDVSALPLSSPPPAGTTYAAPEPALGYLHANCGHCHNENGSAWVNSQMILRLSADERVAATTDLARTTIGVPLQQWLGHGFATRIVSGDPDNSALLYRMTQRTQNMQMPPIATEVPDPTGIDLVRQWIQSL